MDKSPFRNPPAPRPGCHCRLSVFSSCPEGRASCLHPYVRKHPCPTARCRSPEMLNTRVVMDSWAPVDT